MNLDLLTGVFVGIAASCMFALHVYTSRRRPNWPSFPEYLRWGIVVTGGVFMVWSVDLFSLSRVAGSEPGHVDAVAVLACGGLAYVLAALTVWAVSSYMPAQTRYRLEWLRHTLTREPSLAPVLVEKSEVADVAHAAGIPAVAPNEPPAAAYREAGRLASAYDRRQSRG